LGLKHCHTRAARRRGSVDNDMMLGNVQGFLDKKELLDKYDLISACCANKFKAFGPFMLYATALAVSSLVGSTRT
jgi:hypothetical protein